MYPFTQHLHQLPTMARRRLRFRCTRAQADDPPELAVLARLAALLESGAHALPVEDWAEVLLLLAPEDYDEPPAAEGPTTHLPGSIAKMAVLAGRIARGEAAFHPQDGLPAWREFICQELAGDGWGLAVERRGRRGRLTRRC